MYDMIHPPVRPSNSSRVALLFIALVLSGLSSVAADVAAQIKQSPRTHPRLFITKHHDTALLKKINADPVLTEAKTILIQQANSLEDISPVIHEKQGRRMLHVSRLCLSRVMTLSSAYQFTGNTNFAARAEKEMLAAASFKDWNPSHFLDVAEMTAALAIGYDWLSDALDPSARTIIRQAIVEKGLKTSLRGGWWVDTHNNWNQVCHGGLTLGALAVMTEEPALAVKIINRAIKKLPTAMHEYAPDGAYPEGPSYWRYGTTYNVIMIAALESALNTDFGLSETEGFLNTSDYYIHSRGPQGLHFNYSDGREGTSPSAALYWFAKKRQAPHLLQYERKLFKSNLANMHRSPKTLSSTLPLALIWYPAEEKDAATPSLHWTGNGPSPVSFHRSDWNSEQATFFGFKGGTPAASHGHMDVGCFVIDASGERWASDLGMQGYYSLESKGIGLWEREQDGQRWSVFRLNTFSHNTLVVNGQQQRVAGFAPIIQFSDTAPMPHTIIDMSSLYKTQLASAQRGMALLADKSVLIQDDLRSNDKKAKVRWAMVTAAKIELQGNHATLSIGETSMELTVLHPKNAILEIINVSDPRADYDAANPNKQMIAFTTHLPPNTSEQLIVHVASPNANTPKTTPLSDWKSH